MKIAVIALANDAVVLTRNVQHFSKVPDLKFEGLVSLTRRQKGGLSGLGALQKLKYFTLEWYRQEDKTAEDYRAVFDAYTRRLESVRDTLSENLLILAKLPGVDDGLIVEARHEREQRRFMLTLRCGNLRMGYYDLVLTYEDAAISQPDAWILARIARMTNERRGDDIANHELDVTPDGRIEHRFLFHPGHWFAIRCRTLQWEKINRPNRELPVLPDRFPDGPVTTLYGWKNRSYGRRKLI